MKKDTIPTKVWKTLREILEWLAPLGAFNFSKIIKIIKAIWK